MESDEKLVPVFIPALSVLLLRAEQLKALPLTEDEVSRIRDQSVCMMVPESHAQQLTESRGYHDIDPEKCWQDWQTMRKEAIADAEQMEA